MVTRREAAMAKALRDVLALSTYKNGLDNADVTDMQEDLTAIRETARAALAFKARPTRRRAVLSVRNGKAGLDWCDRGVKVTVRDFDRGVELVYADSGDDRRALHGSPDRCLSGGCGACDERERMRLGGLDELARKVYGKGWAELPDDGPEQDHIAGEYDKGVR